MVAPSQPKPSHPAPSFITTYSLSPGSLAHRHGLCCTHTGLSRLFLNHPIFLKRSLFYLEISNIEACGLSAVPVFCIFSSFIHLKSSAPPSKERTPGTGSYCVPDLGLKTFPGCSGNQTAVFPVNPFPALKLESRSESCSGAPCDIPTSLSGQAPRLRAVLTTCHAHMQQACAQLLMRSNMRRLKKTTTQLLNYRLQSFTIWEQKSRFM